MNNIRNLYWYNKLKKADLIIRKILKEEDNTKKPLKIEKVPSEAKKNPQDFLKDKSAIVANFTKVTASSKNEFNAFFKEVALVVDGSAEQLKNIELECKNIFADLTAFKNEVEKVTGKSPITQKIEVGREMLRKLSVMKRTYNKRLNDAIIKKQELEDKLSQFYDNEEYQALEQAISSLEAQKDELAKRYGADLLQTDADKLDAELTSIEKELKDSMAEKEKEMKETIRELRLIIEAVTEIPKNLIQNVKLTFQAFGELVQVSKNPVTKTMSQEGIEFIMDRPELMQILGQFITITETVDDVRAVKVKMDDIKAYISQIQLKSKEELDELINKNAEDSNIITEGIFTDIISESVIKIIKRGKKVFKHMLSYLKIVKTNINPKLITISQDINTINTKIINQRVEIEKLHGSISEKKKR